MAMELIKENIEYEQLLGSQTIDNVIKEEYVIPDVQPDVRKILMLDAKPKISNKEVMQNKVYVEGEIEYNILYLANGDENTEVYNVIYTKEFSSYIDLNGAMSNMTCSIECNIEHMECNIINERKISIEGIVELNISVYTKHDFQIIKDVDSVEDVQLLKNPSFIDKIVGVARNEFISKAHIQVPMDKPEVDTILKCDVNVHKADINLLENKVRIEAFTRVQVLYKATGSRELCSVEDDIFINNEIDLPGVDQFMNSATEFEIKNVDVHIKEDDLGENRIIDVEATIESETRIMHKEEFDMIEDAYSPTRALKMDKKDYELNVMLGQNMIETIIRENIDVPNEELKPIDVIMCSGKLSVTDKKIVEDKVIVDGLLNVQAIYKTKDNDRYISVASEEIPFTFSVDIPGAKIDMDCTAKVYLESLEAGVEANTIGVKCVARIYARVDYRTNKEFLVDIVTVEDEVVKKKASVTIYVVQDGDTLWKIAKSYYTTVEELIKINELESDNLTVGQKLIIPGRAII